jgi:hypothetical protein
MKKIALAAALSVAATSAFAGGAPEAAMEPAAVAQASSSGAGYVVPLLLLLALAVAAANR